MHQYLAGIPCSASVRALKLMFLPTMSNAVFFFQNVIQYLSIWEDKH